MTSSSHFGVWSSDALTELHRTAMWQFLRFVSAPLAGDSCLLVRGVLQPPGRCDVTRVVMWDGRDLGSSVAYDLPLVEDGGNIPWSDLIATVRSVLGNKRGTGRALHGERDPLGMPVVDLGGDVLRFLANPVFDLTDAFHSAVSVLRPPAPEQEDRLQLSGFLLLGHSTVRLYVDEQTLPGRVGLDVTLLDQDGRVIGGHTALMSALPSLVPDELEGTRSKARDPYCTTVHDFTYW